MDTNAALGMGAQLAFGAATGGMGPLAMQAAPAVTGALSSLTSSLPGLGGQDAPMSATSGNSGALTNSGTFGAVNIGSDPLAVWGYTPRRSGQLAAAAPPGVSYSSTITASPLVLALAAGAAVAFLVFKKR